MVTTDNVATTCSQQLTLFIKLALTERSKIRKKEKLHDTSKRTD
jgi:hypothetical protein